VRERRDHPRLRVRPPRCGYGAAVVMVAAAGIVNSALVSIRGRAVALVHGFAQATGMRRRSSGCQRERSESSDEREKEQKSGRLAVHVLLCESEPQRGASIEQNRERVQPRQEF